MICREGERFPSRDGVCLIIGSKWWATAICGVRNGKRTWFRFLLHRKVTAWWMNRQWRRRMVVK